MKKILLTGASGFIGRNIKESYLSQRYEICTPSSSVLNLCDYESVEKFFIDNEFDAIIHCACKPGHRAVKDNSLILETNLKMFENLLKYKNSFAKFINLGSGSVYDRSNDICNVSEETTATVACKDELGKCQTMINNKIKELPSSVNLLLFGVFGRYEDYSIRFISNAICKTLFDLPITLRQNRNFSYLCVDDLMSVLEFFIENEAKHKSYNVVPEDKTELYTLAELVKSISTSEVPIILSEPEYGLDYTGDNTRLKGEFTALKFTKIEDSITKLYNYYNSHKDEINKELLLTDK